VIVGGLVEPRPPCDSKLAAGCGLGRSASMVRRALLTLFPLVLAALTLVSATPGASRGETQAAAGWSSAAELVSVVHRNLAQDVSDDDTVSQRADVDDDPAERIIRVAVAFVWPGSQSEERILRASERAGPTHRPCAANPRAPPTA
jgi:hypothetical protein